VTVSAAHFVTLLLKLFPLIGCENFLQPLICLPANFRYSRLRFFSKGLKLRPGVAQYLVDLRLLIGVQLKRIEHALEPILTRKFAT
jgi:hypothetical protein